MSAGSVYEKPEVNNTDNVYETVAEENKVRIPTRTMSDNSKITSRTFWTVIILIILLFVVCLVSISVAVVALMKANDTDKHLESRLAAVEAKDKDVEVEGTILALKAKVTVLEAAFNSIKGYKQTLFSVGLTAYQTTVTDGQIIPFDKIMIDNGNNYDIRTSSYHVPMDGYYLFSVQKTDGNYNGRFSIMVDNDEYAHNSLETPSSDGHPTSSSTLIIQLKKDQLVRVKNYGSTFIYGGNRMESWFCGTMLYPLED